MANEVLSNSQMAEADRRTIESGVDGFVLMRRAARAVADIILSEFERQNVLVLCGPGNNGGDGFVIASLLKERGWDVWLASMKGVAELEGDVSKAAQLWEGDVLSFDNLQPQKDELVIDAVFGTGFSGALGAPVAGVFERINRQGNSVVAVDISSGVNGDSGAVDPHALRAGFTVTFHRKKLGHVLYPGAGHCGAVRVADIGITQNLEYSALENHPDLWRSHLPEKRADQHKYDYGMACIYGAPDLTGATRLAAEGCARIGAGLVNVLCEEKIAGIYRSTLPAHILVRDDPTWTDKRITAKLYGPGGLLKKPDYKSDTPTVLDADALMKLPKSLKTLKPHFVLTPHEGEFAKAFPKLEGTKVENAVAAAKQYNAHIVLKGADTVVASPDGRVVVNTNAPGSLATAGTGDVLAGMITGLLTQSMAPFEAACAAVWIHGGAARRFGPGLVASDLPGQLPGVVLDLN